MRFSLWATVFLGSDIVSSTLVSIARETYLPYFPSVGLESVANSYLYLNWAVVNGSLFANDDCVFPPLRPMRLHAPRRDDPANIPSKEDIVELSYALEAQPLPDKNGSVPTFIRVRVDLLDSKGASVTSDTVVVDLFRQVDGSTLVSQILLEPIQTQDEGRSHSDRPWSMDLWSPIIHGCHRDRIFMRLMHHFILPGFLGVTLGLIAWLCGFALVRLFMSLCACFSHRKNKCHRLPMGIVEGGYQELDPAVIQEKKGLHGSLKTDERDKICIPRWMEKEERERGRSN